VSVHVLAESSILTISFQADTPTTRVMFQESQHAARARSLDQGGHTFAEECARINQQRLPMGLLLLAVLHVIHMLVFLPAVSHNGSAEDRWMFSIGIAHAVMLPVALIGALLARRLQSSPVMAGDTPRRWRHLPIMMAALYLGFAALVTGFDQLAAPTPIAFITGSIGLAIYLRWRLVPSLVIFAAATALVIAFVEAWQTDPALRRSVEVNCATVATIAFLIARSSAGLHRQIWEDRLIILRQARTDSLTGVLTRGYFLDLARAAATKRGAIVLIDIDQLKAINDRSGHAAGDAAIIAVSRAMRVSAGPRAVLGRLGGDELCILLPEADSASALVVAEQLRAMTERTGPTISVGVATSIPGETAERWLARADAAMYGAKDGGRNRVRMSV